MKFKNYLGSELSSNDFTTVCQSTAAYRSEILVDSCKESIEAGKHTILDEFLIRRWSKTTLHNFELDDSLYDLQMFSVNGEDVEKELEVISKEIEYILDYFGQNVTFHGARLRDATTWEFTAKFWPEGDGSLVSTTPAGHRPISTRSSDSGTRYGIYLEDFSNPGGVA